MAAVAVLLVLPFGAHNAVDAGEAWEAVRLRLFQLARIWIVKGKVQVRGGA